uniref:Uncharacterized protein n=1 Tax=Globodera rostochiensis TaxID=31243 RepID=A0A914IF74_GLORO
MQNCKTCLAHTVHHSTQLTKIYKNAKDTKELLIKGTRIRTPSQRPPQPPALTTRPSQRQIPSQSANEDF